MNDQQIEAAIDEVVGQPLQLPQIGRYKREVVKAVRPYGYKVWTSSRVTDGFSIQFVHKDMEDEPETFQATLQDLGFEDVKVEPELSSISEKIEVLIPFSK